MIQERETFGQKKTIKNDHLRNERKESVTIMLILQINKNVSFCKLKNVPEESLFQEKQDFR